MGFWTPVVILAMAVGNFGIWAYLFPDGRIWGLGSSLVASGMLLYCLVRRSRWTPAGQLLAALVFQAVVSCAFGTIRDIAGLSAPAWYLALAIGLIFAVQILFSAATLIRIAEMADAVGRIENSPGSVPLPPPKDGVFQPLVSIHIPCSREPPEVVIASIESLARLRYPNFEVLVVDNNTDDPSLWRPVEEYCRGLGPRFRFFSLGTWPGHKAGALNFALSQTHPDAELIGIVDADWTVEPDWLDEAVPYFRDATLGSLQGTHSYRDGGSSFFKRIEQDECNGPFRTSLLRRNEDNAAPLSGAMALLRRRTLSEIGGWNEQIIGEDGELGVRILNSGKRVLYLDGKVHGHGLLPGDFSTYARQRQRWCYAVIQVLKLHRGLFSGRSGALNRVQRFHFLKDWLRVIGFSLYPIFTAIGIGGTLALLGFPRLRSFLPAGFVTVALILAGVDFVNLFWAYRSHLKIAKRRVFFVFLAQLSLLPSVSRAIWWALFDRPLAFQRTDRHRNHSTFFKLLADVSGQALLAAILLSLAVTVLFASGFPSFGGALYSASLAILSLPYLSAVAMSAISYFSAERRQPDRPAAAPTMRFLFLSQSCPYREGGMETRSREVAIRMARLGYEITYLCARTRIDELPEENREGLRILRKKILPNWLLKRFPFPSYFTLAMANLLMGFHLWRLLRRESFDAIREEVAPVPVSGPWAFRRLRARRIGVVHGLPVIRSSWIQLYGPIFGLYGYGMEKALRRGRLAYDGIMVPAKWYAESLHSETSLRQPILLLPNGVDLRGFQAPASERRKELLTRLLCVGRLAPNKGHRFLLEGLAQARKRIPDLRLTILGRGTLEAALRRQARALGIDSQVDFAHYIKEADIPAFYRSFDLLVMPSLLEGFNIVLLEAMASGLPVLASDIPGFRDVADATIATFFNPSDASDLALKLVQLASDPERAAAMAARATGRVQGLGWDEIASRELDFLLGDESAYLQSSSAMRA